MVDEPINLTQLLHAWGEGDSEAMAAVATLVNEELRAMARRLLAGESSGAEWRPTELVDEAYLRLLDWHGVQWQNRAHFFGTVAEMMRRVLNVEMRFFGGFSVEETGEALGISRRTVINDWNTARAWLHHELITVN